jgi:UDP-glucose 4-epimerase
MNVLATGGAGFIGSHTCVELLNTGHGVIVVDNLLNSKEESLRRVERITGKRPVFCRVDLLDRAALAAVFAQHKPDAVIHFAGLKAVGESVQIPLRYYHNNITGTLVLLEVMKEAGVRSLVFSSSATVYGVPTRLPLTEDSPLSVTNPYGRTKLMIEDILRDLHVSDPTWNLVLLRYFNPVGAHPSGLIGEDPNGIPNNLFPFIAQVAVGKRAEVKIFGRDYPTRDGTGVRDYIHVVDLARGHCQALEVMARGPGLRTYNLGTGRGSSVLEAIQAFAKASGRPIPYSFAPRRPGDIAECYADPARANRELGWTAQFDLDRMCADHWRWQSQNPNGYE